MEAYEAVPAIGAESPVLPHSYLRPAERALRSGGVESTPSGARQGGELPAGDLFQRRTDSLRALQDIGG